MKSQALQEMIKKIFSDEKTKSQFMASPESVISNYSLTETEKKAVLSTHARLAPTAGNSTQLEAVIGPMAIWV